MKNIEIIFENKNSERLDKAVSLLVEEISRNYAEKLIEKEFITVNDKIVTKKYKLSYGDKIKITLPDPISNEVKPQDISLNVIYEDNDLLVVDKPQGMVVHPAPGNYTDTLVNALLHHCGESLSGINGVQRPGILHRIDKNTSGLLIVAKNDVSHKFLAKQIKDHTFTREYEAIICGKLKSHSGTIRTQIGRHRTFRKKMAVLDFGGRSAITHYEVLKEYDKYSHVRLKLETGRTHQIRVHMAYMKCPILGDDLYGNNKNNEFKFLKGQCLHAKKIGFVHPTTLKYMEFDSRYPEYFKKIIDILNNE